MAVNEKNYRTDICLAGRFAPSPTGRMHLGNVYTALISWLAARSRRAPWILRIEDLDPQRSSADHALRIEDDLAWLGLDFDEGGVDDRGPHGPYSQSRRSAYYAEALEYLRDKGLLYACRCRRADILATQAPHQSDGRVIYGGRCRPPLMPAPWRETDKPYATRLYVPNRDIVFDDAVFGRQSINLARDCGDFIVQRADGAWAYQLAVVVDDAAMGVGEVVRGADLLLSAAQQLYIYELLGYTAPRFAHLPLICNKDGIRLSKRDNSLSMASLRERFTSRELIGRIAYIAGIGDGSPATPAELVAVFDLSKIHASEKIICPDNLF